MKQGANQDKEAKENNWSHGIAVIMLACHASDESSTLSGSAINIAG